MQGNKLRSAFKQAMPRRPLLMHDNRAIAKQELSMSRCRILAGSLQYLLFAISCLDSRRNSSLTQSNRTALANMIGKGR